MVRRLQPDPELEGLVREANDSVSGIAARPASRQPVPATSGSASSPEPSRRWSFPERRVEGDEWLDKLLDRATRSHASDVLLTAEAPPMLRIDGRLSPLGDQPLTGEACGLLCASLVPSTRRGRLEREGVLDFSQGLAQGGRIRCNVHRAADNWAAAVRLFPASIPDLDVLGLPNQLDRLADLAFGLVLVTGPTGCGKSTTLAAIVRRILARRAVHLLTIEDPVEYEHGHGKGLVEHIEIGRDAVSFPTALRSALRQDPDVLLIGEMRDPDSISIAITAAETGHLVLSTLHTGDAPQTIHRILDSYPAAQMGVVRTQLSISLAAVVSQQLVPRKDGRGRVPAVEVLVATPAVRNLIRQGRIEQLPTHLTIERSAGMIELDQSLARLVRRGLVAVEEARPRARSPQDFDKLLAAG